MTIPRNLLSTIFQSRQKMKKLFIAIAFLLSLSTIISAESKNEIIIQACLAGFNYKKAVKYANLKIKAQDTEKVLSAREVKKLEKYQAKLEAGQAKAKELEETNPVKAAAKKEKIVSKTTLNNQRREAREAYEDYIYKNKTDDDIPINPKTGFPEILETPFVTFDEGLSYAMVTRLQNQEEYKRNNFVWQDHMLGAYFALKSSNMKPCDSMLRIQAYYPFYYTFDGMRQYPTQTILYAFDLFWGPSFHTDMWKYIILDYSFGLHYMYQLSDEYHLNYLGAAFVAGIELPVARRWTIVNNGTFTLDYANFGTNKVVQPFDYSWSYQFSLGVRYSKRKLHKYAYLHHIEKKEKIEKKEE